MDDEGGGQAAFAEAEGGAPPVSEQVEAEEVGVRRLSLEAAGGVVKEQEGEETKPREEAGSAESEQVTTETDGEEGIQHLELSSFFFGSVQKVSHTHAV